MSRGDSPLAGRRPAPLKSMNTMGIQSNTPLSALTSPTSQNNISGLPLAGLNNLQSPKVIRSPQLPSESLNLGSVPSTGKAPIFARELKDVEHWFSLLNSHEQSCVITALAQQSSQQQLRTYSCLIDQQLSEHAKGGAATTMSANTSSGTTSKQCTTTQSTMNLPSSAGADKSNYAHVFPSLGYSPWKADSRPQSSEWPEKRSPTSASAEIESPWRAFTPNNAPAGQAPERSLLYSYRMYNSSLSLNYPYSAPNSAYPYFAQQGAGSTASSGTSSSVVAPPSTGVQSSMSSSQVPGPVTSAPASPAKSGAGVGSGVHAPVSSSIAPGSASVAPSSGLPASTVPTFNASPVAKTGTPVAPSSAPSSVPSHASAMNALNGEHKPRSRRNVNVIDLELLSDIGAWLRSLRLHKYTGNLSGLTWQEVIKLNDEDLEKRGVNALGARRKLLKMFQEIKQAQDDGLIE